MRKKKMFPPTETWWESATEALLQEYEALAKNGSPASETDGESLGKIKMRLIGYDAHFESESKTERGDALLQRIRSLPYFSCWYIANRDRWMDYILVHRENCVKIIQYYLSQMEGEEETLHIQVLKARAEMALEYIREAEMYTRETPDNNRKIAQARAIIYSERHGKGFINRYMEYARDRRENKRGCANWKLS